MTFQQNLSTVMLDGRQYVDVMALEIFLHDAAAQLLDEGALEGAEALTRIEYIMSAITSRQRTIEI